MTRSLLLAAGLALAACGDAADSTTPTPLAEGAVEVPADSGAVAPRLTRDADGTPLLSWVAPTPDGHALRVARWTGDGWGTPETVDQGADWFVNWADTPGVVPLGAGLMAHTLTRHPQGDSPYAYDVTVRPVGAAAGLLHDDGVAAEHGFVSAVPLADGRAGLVWLDGRAQGGGHGGHGAGAMSLRFATVDAAGQLADEAVVDARTCDCCPTAMVATPSGLVAAYRDRSEHEIRDIAVARRVNGRWGASSIPHADGWRIEGCPVNGPALAADGDRVGMAWFTGADSSSVRFSVSGDAAQTWGPAVRIDGGAPIGRVGVAMLDGGDAVVSWLESVGEGAELRIRRVAPGGVLGPVHTVATVDAGRASGVPRVLVVGGQALVAWTDPAAATLRSALVTP